MEIALVCIPYQVDISRWGYARGPQAFLDVGLIEILQANGHHVRDPLWVEIPRAERTRDSVTNLGRIARQTAQAVAEGLRHPGSIVVALEGDCTKAPGTLGGLAQSKGAPGIVWFDAHGDLCTMETTTSGCLGGMPYAVALGWEFPDWRQAAGLETPVRPEAAVLIGTSDLDPAEEEALVQHPILHFDAKKLSQPGVIENVERALQSRAHEAAAWYVHIDLDVAGPEVVPGGLTPAPYWPSRQSLIEAGEAVAHSVAVSVIALSSYNPSGDPHRRGALFGIEMLTTIIRHLCEHT